MPRKKKNSETSPLQQAYSSKKEYEVTLRDQEEKAWAKLLKKAEASKRGKSLRLVSLPKQEQAAVVYSLMEEGALPLSPREEARVLRAIEVDPGPVPDVDLFGDPLKPQVSQTSPVDVESSSLQDVKGQRGLFDPPEPEAKLPPRPKTPFDKLTQKGRILGRKMGFSPKLLEKSSNGFRQATSPEIPTSAAPKASPKGILGLASKGWSKLGRGGQIGLAIGAVDLLLNPAVSYVEGLGDDLNLGSRVDRRLERMISGQEKVEQFERMRGKRDRKVAELMQRNTLLLAQNAPHLFNQLMAGRSLPRGATVIGGEPRSDLVQEVAMGMTQGRFAPPQEGQLPLGGE